ncbi:MAG: GNAT family N-acetyltransferase [Pseudomonadota bacterium]
MAVTATTSNDCVIAPAVGAADLDAVRRLFCAYAESMHYAVCFRSFEQELARLPGNYAPPQGALLLAKRAGEDVGVVAVKPLGQGRAEMKRLYVVETARGLGLGRALARAAIAAARAAGHEELALETLPGMTAARALYASLGFRPAVSAAQGIDRFVLTL